MSFMRRFYPLFVALWNHTDWTELLKVLNTGCDFVVLTSSKTFFLSKMWHSIMVCVCGVHVHVCDCVCVWRACVCVCVVCMCVCVCVCVCVCSRQGREQGATTSSSTSTALVVCIDHVRWLWRIWYSNSDLIHYSLTVIIRPSPVSLNHFTTLQVSHQFQKSLRRGLQLGRFSSKTWAEKVAFEIWMASC